MAELTLSQLNGRFKLLNRPMALPSKCAVCGAVDRPVIDLDMDLDIYGVVYICVECMKAAATILGMVDGALLTRAELVQRNHEDQLTAAKDVTDEYVARFSDLTRAFGDRLRDISSSDVASDENLLDAKSRENLSSSGVAGREDGQVITEGDFPPGDERPARLSGSSGNGLGSLFD